MSRLLNLLLVLVLSEAWVSGQDVWRKEGISFIPNAGQWPGPALFVARYEGVLAVVEQDRMRIHRSADDATGDGVALSLVFEGCAADARVEGLEQGPETYNFFIGGDPARWRTGLRGFSRVRYRGLHPGVDLQWREQGGLLEYDVLVAPGAELSSLVVRAEGVLSLRSGDGNELLMETAAGLVRQTAPVAWQETPGGDRMPLQCHYRVFEGSRYGFEVEGRNPELRLVVDPGLIWSTYLGGAANDFARAVEIDASGDVFAAGQAQSLLPPATALGAGGGWDGFLARFRPSLAGAAQLQWMTFIGGTADDMVMALTPACGGGNNCPSLAITGSTTSADFPVTAGSFQAVHGGGTDAFIAQLDAATGANLNMSTDFGGTAHEFGHFVHARNGLLTVVGYTDSSGLPTTPGAFQSTLAGGRDAFVARFDPSQAGPAQLVYMTYLGGGGNEGTQPVSAFIAFADGSIRCLASNPSGQITVAGVTASSDFPLQNPYQAFNHPGSYDVFVCRLDPAQTGAQQLVWSTYLGAPGPETVSALNDDNAGRVFLAGSTTSAQFPVTAASAFQPVHASSANGLPDAYVVRLDPGLPGPAQLVYSTFLGGAGADRCSALIEGNDVGGIDNGIITITGTTDSVAVPPYFPTTSGALFSLATNTPFNIPVTLSWVAKIDLEQPVPSNQLIYSTLFGAQAGGQMSFDLALDSDGGAVVAGATLSAGVPSTPGTYQPAYAGGICGWLAWFDLLPTGAVRAGAPTPGPSGRPVIGVRSQPRVGNSGFAFTCRGAPPLGAGVFGVSLSLLIPAVQFCGVSVHISLNEAVVFASAVASETGYSEWEIPIPANPALAGFSVATQYLWLEPAGGCSASAALVATIQP